METSSPTRKLFGTDGVRGVANIEPMTTETAMRLGRAVAYLFQHPANGSGQGGPHPRHRGKIVIGKDTRLSGYMFEQAMAAGICSMGADVLLCGPLPTPGIAFITSSMRADAGVVISASHNPYQDNGIKIFAADGFKLPDAAEARIEELLTSPTLDAARPPASDVGRARRIDDARGRYIVFLKQSFPRQQTLDGVKIVVDCAHGAAYRVAPEVMQELGATVYPLGDEPSGKNINEHVGALYPQAMCQAVIDTGAQVGIALDGDADRVIFADERGEIVDGDAIMAMCARRMLRRGELKQNTLVATVMSNLGLERAIAADGGRLVRTQVGDRYVVEEMRNSGYNLGGEQSGHIIFLDHMTTGDGMIAALQVLAILHEEGKPLSELARRMERVPQVLLSVNVKQRLPLETLPAVQSLVKEIQERLQKEGRVLIRYSGTEPKVRVMIEGPDQTLISRYAQDIATELQRACGT